MKVLQMIIVNWLWCCYSPAPESGESSSCELGVTRCGVNLRFDIPRRCPISLLSADGWAVYITPAEVQLYPRAILWSIRRSHLVRRHPNTFTRIFQKSKLFVYNISIYIQVEDEDKSRADFDIYPPYEDPPYERRSIWQHSWSLWPGQSKKGQLSLRRMP